MEYAVSHGVTKQAVDHWRRRGYVVFGGSGMIDQEASDERLRAFGLGRFRGDKTAGRAFTGMVQAHGELLPFDEAVRVKENYLALLRKLEYEQKARSVVAVTEVMGILLKHLRPIRERLLRLPAEVAPRIMGCQTPAEAKAIIETAVHSAMSDMADFATAEAAKKRQEAP